MYPEFYITYLVKQPIDTTFQIRQNENSAENQFAYIYFSCIWFDRLSMSWGIWRRSSGSTSKDNRRLKHQAQWSTRKLFWNLAGCLHPVKVSCKGGMDAGIIGCGRRCVQGMLDLDCRPNEVGGLYQVAEIGGVFESNSGSFRRLTFPLRRYFKFILAMDYKCASLAPFAGAQMYVHMNYAPAIPYSRNSVSRSEPNHDSRQQRKKQAKGSE